MSFLLRTTAHMLRVAESCAFINLIENIPQALTQKSVDLSLLPRVGSAAALCTAQSHHQQEGARSIFAKTESPYQSVEDGEKSSGEISPIMSSYTDGVVSVKRNKKVYKISHRIYRPHMLSNTKLVPLVVIHGGPGLPSEYLYPLADLIPSGRAIIFFDQLGCGRSSKPKNRDAYSTSKSVDDLSTLLSNLRINRFHLYGHSYGGVLAYEYAKKIVESEKKKENDVTGKSGKKSDSSPQCLSIILSNTSTSMKLSSNERERLLQGMAQEENGDNKSNLYKRFMFTHQCRTKEMPQALHDAFQHLGTMWSGTDVVIDYVASPPSPSSETELPTLPPALIIKGEHDFVTEKCTEGWKKIFGHCNIREVLMHDCAHYCHFEAGQVYGNLVDSFCSEYD